MSAYYNEFDPQAAAWLRRLIKRGHLPEGEVDERDIREVQADEIRGFTQHHFFAGIGGWAYALRLAGWPDDRPVLTGSPPCQPFSVAGKGLGARDERHLAPHFLGLVAALRPFVVFGEQVAAAVTKDTWLDDLLDALEGAGYATGAAVTPACSVGAPHIRQRLWFVGRLANPDHAKRREKHKCRTDGCDGADERRQEAHGEPGARSKVYGLGDVSVERRQQDPRSAPRHGPADASAAGWGDTDWLLCRDGKWRSVESGTFPLADGVSARVGRLRGYGNAIVPQVAAEIVKTVMERGALGPHWRPSDGQS